MERYTNTVEAFMIDLHCHIIPWVDDGAENEKNNRCDALAVAQSRKFANQ